ncbi:MAG: small-conductance mechanosensitive ion channel [Parcubacteria group bacterium Gr01-1014_72]|nr:MAG: small-conductance mechanosensitive ion channel [Parcubacteria group bacterium Gr01-1014_72]
MLLDTLSTTISSSFQDVWAGVAEVIDNILRGARVEEALRRAGLNLDSGAFLGALVKWFIIIVFLVASLDVLGLNDVNAFLQGVVLSYLPRVIAAVLILLVSVVIAEFMERVVVHAARAASVQSAHFLGTVTRWSIWIFAVLSALLHLGIAAPLVQTIFTGIVVAISLAVGLSFGLGGQDAAGKFIDRLKQDIAHRNQ